MKESVDGNNFPIQVCRNVPKFREQMKEAKLYSLYKEWSKFKLFFDKQPEALLEPLDWFGNTAMHVATRSNDPKLLRGLLRLMEKDQKRLEALSKENTRGNTVFHHVIHSPNMEMVDVLLGYKYLRPRLPEEIGASVGEDERKLLQQTNKLGETPVCRAARCGKIHMLVHLKKYYLHDQDMRIHFPKQVSQKPQNTENNPEELRASGEDTENSKDCHADSENPGDSEDYGKSGNRENSILYLAIASQYMDVAMWLISEVDGIEEQAHVDNEDGLTCLQLLSQMPSCFGSHIIHDMRSVEKFIYFLLPMPRYPEHKYESFSDDDDIYQRDQSINDRSQNRDIESGVYSTKQPTSVLSRINQGLWEFTAHAISRINRAFWKFIAHERGEIDRIWEKKRQHRLAKKLVEELVKKDRNLLWKPNDTTQITLPTITPPNVHARRIKVDKTQSMSGYGFTGYHFKSPLHLAASTGIVEIVECIIKRYPEALAHVEEQQNILHVAVKHRQRKIYRLIKRNGALKWMASKLCNKGRTVLHQVSRMDYYNGGNRAGVVFQLQDELRWFQRVKRAIPPPLILHSNEDKLKANELVDIEHEDMLKEAQDWIKGTAQSCSAVAVLVATVVFAAAYTVPGGFNENGSPIFLNSPLFRLFTIADIVALACSLVSVVMFLSILTSPFEMENFLKSLPQKLELGFSLLFWSLIITMLAFSSTILLNNRLEKNKWTTSLTCSVTFFPLALFGLMQFPIYMAVKSRLKRILKNCKKKLPKRFTKKAGNNKYSKILY